MDDAYELIDAGDGARLERFGSMLVDRPHAGALAPRRDAASWTAAALRFDRDRGWSGPGLAAARTGWTVRIRDIAMGLHPTEAGQVGLFPEHAAQLGLLTESVVARWTEGSPVAVLNLFGYTGLATLAMAGAGAAVTHVDASRPSVAWARENAAANGLADRPIRWIVDDARVYVAREARRGRRYDGIVLDPPSYGHGGRGAAWQLATDLPALLDGCVELLDEGAFLVLTTHTEGYGPATLGELLRSAIGAAFGPASGGRHIVGDVALAAASGVRLELGAFAAWDGRA